MGLRSLTLFAKFSLIFVLAYFLEPGEVALYGLVVAVVAYSLYGLGFNFYSFSTRELLGSSPDQWARLLRDQSIFFGLIYVLVLPSLLLIFILGLLPWSVAPWFFVLVVMEHIGQELNRLLVAMSRQLLASAVLFLRSGVWAAAIAFLFWYSESYRKLELVFGAWAIGACLACLLGFSMLCSLDRRCLEIKVDWVWIRKGVRVALPLLVATLAIRAVFTIDRYWVEEIAGAEILAAYVLFAGVSSAVTAFLEAGVFVFQYPKVVSAYKNNDANLFYKGMLDLFKQTFFVAVLLCIAAAFLIHPVLAWVNKEVYLQNVELLYLLLIAIFLYSISLVPHYGIYAMSKDKHILVSHMIALALFFITATMLERASSFYAIPLALCVSFSFMIVYKFAVFFYFKSRVSWETVN